MQRQGQMMTPEQVWEDYDPCRESLEVEVLKQWTEDGILFKELFFTGKTTGDEKTRIYAIYSAPLDGKLLPGILHVHGGGQTVNTDALKYWNVRGYAALSYNWGGRRTDGRPYTLWGSALAHANHLDAGERMMATVPNVRASSCYEWAVAGRRALTLLAEQPEVDPNKLGAFGVSMGGTLLWTLAAIDERIRAGCAIYGLGWHDFKEEYHSVTGDKPDYSEEAARIWDCGMEPEAYAPRIRCPMLYVSGTNDFYGKMDQVYEVMDALPEKTPRRQSFTPGFNHYVHWEQADNVHRWMDTWLRGIGHWPNTPEVSIRTDSSGQPELVIKPTQVSEPEFNADCSPSITRVEAYCALGNPHAVSRHWRLPNAVASGEEWRATLGVSDRYGTVAYAFANVYYTSGICLSSNLLKQPLGGAKDTGSTASVHDAAYQAPVQAQMPGHEAEYPPVQAPVSVYDAEYQAPVQAPVPVPTVDYPTPIQMPVQGPVSGRPAKVLYDGSSGLGGWVTNSPDADPFPGRYSPISMAESKDGVKGFRPDKNLSPITYIVGDPEFRGRAGDMLHFQIFCRHAAEFAVLVQQRHFPSHTRSYKCQANLEGSGQWQRFAFVPESFMHEESREALNGWEHVDYLELRKPEDGWPDEQIIFTDFKWIPVPE